ncbi:MAG: TonB-dependent receptor [Methylobacter sp.]|uniref:TonB-dependent receptor domain-containing protein n=1 Tax=Methylobacter sp. TaxID=2051955 RepID=UPI0027300310|nr:TonB-dependent receptor [Methylobacter sp.]MDP1666806.1 TonB-dependent receptor [Methylobacter sp.]MDP1970727.1 TonB-dependent receptor [Methylobacter sp.]
MQKFIFGSLLLTGFNAQLHAQETPQNLPDLVVTATRTETAKNQLAAAATVYTRKDIERLQAKTLPELLSGTTGIDIVQSGGYGKDTNIYMRGTNSDHVLVLIDGIKIGSVTSGTTPFQFIPIDQVERVEIIRGPQSSLYGSEAIGGVIQIFTRKGGREDKPSVTLDAGGGSYDTYRASGSVSGKWENSWYTLASSQFGSQGFNSRQPIPGRFGVNQPDKDGYLNTALNARLGHRFDNKAEVEAFFMRAEGKSEFDGNFQNKTEFVEQTVGTTAGMNILDNWRSLLRLGQSRDEGDNFAPDGTFASRFSSTRWNASWLNEVALSDDHQLIIGSDYRLDQVDSSTIYNETSRYDAGIFTELHSRILDDHFINASVRGDKNEAFGDQLTGNFGWRYNGNHDISPFASFGNAFKAPTFNQLYFPGFGNPSLKAEQSTSFEAGVAGDHDWLQWELRGYHTNIDNLIVTVTNPTTFLSSAENVGKAQIDGIEAEIGTQLMGWNSKLNMNLLSPKNRETNEQLPRRAEKTLSYDLSRSIGYFDLGANVLAQSDRFDDALNRTKVAGYVTVDLRTAYHLNKNWMLSAKLNNLLDKQYQTINTYNTADRNFFLSIHYNN